MGPTQKTGFGAGARIGTVENITKTIFKREKLKNTDLLFKFELSFTS
jgi:hypothetical protein